MVYPVVDGHVYRLDLATGQQTKPPINSGFAFKGTGSIDPRGYPLLYSGMGLNQNGSITDGRWRYRIFDLIQNKEVDGWDGTDAGAHPRLGRVRLVFPGECRHRHADRARRRTA